MNVPEAEADAVLFRGALDPRPGCATLAVSKGRLTVLSKTVVAAADCSALLAAPEASGASEGCASLLALAPVWEVMLLLQSVLPSAKTACCNSAIKVVNRRFSFLSF